MRQQTSRVCVLYLILDDLLGEIDNRILDTTLGIVIRVGNLAKLQPMVEDYTVTSIFLLMI